ncbi:transposase domain-containing protein [Streptosporangium amethystogenes]|uniref:transposase domain-containing protein n=1 Tax=Streptosporangium amethystogenes TaxID=2002 RepID=UPI0037A5FD56
MLAAAFSRDLIEEVIDATDTREKQSRRLPAHVMLRYVIGLGLFFGVHHTRPLRRPGVWFSAETSSGKGFRTEPPRVALSISRSGPTSRR